MLITAGKRDPMAAADVTQALADYFASNGAETALFWHQGGHELRQEELREAQGFLAAARAARPGRDPSSPVLRPG